LAFRPEDNLENLVCDPIQYFLSLALADKAFENDITSFEQLCGLGVPPEMDCLRVPWAKEWLGRPVFRDTEGRTFEKRISETKPLGYAKNNILLKTLGRVAGFEEIVTWYDLRRGGGKRLTRRTLPLSVIGC
jgi:hypothetical protein